MRGLISVVIREIVERRSVAGAALAAAILPLVLPLIPGVANWPAGDIRGSMAWGMSLGLTWILAIILGAGLVGSDLTAGRMGFYLTRPISASAIWFGKVLASYVIVICCELFVLLPAILIPGSEVYFRVIFDEPWWSGVGVIFGLPLLLIVAAHALGIMFRARSLWLLLDIAALVSVIAVCWFSIVGFIGADIYVFAVIVAILFTVFLGALLVAGALQVAVGRADLKRSHRVLSIGLWTIMGMASLCIVGYSTWFFAVTIDDLTSVRTVQAPAEGDWIAVTGTCAGRFGYRPTFLYNVKTGASFGIRPSGIRVSWGWQQIQVTFSDNGKAVAWLAQDGPQSWQIEYADLSSGEPQKQVSNLVFRTWPELRLSPEGHSILVLEHRSYSLFELASGRLITAAIPPRDVYVRGVVFDSERTLQMFLVNRENADHPTRTCDIYRFSEDGLTLAGTFGEVGWSLFFDIDRQLSRVFITHRNEAFWSKSLHSLADGSTIMSFPDSRHLGETAFLRDGRFVRVKVENDIASLECESRGDIEGVSINLGSASQIRVGGLLADNRIIVGIWYEDREKGLPETHRSLMVDLGSEDLIPIGADIRPALVYQNLFFGTQPSIEASTLFIDEDRMLLRWNPDTGEMVKMLGGG